MSFLFAILCLMARYKDEIRYTVSAKEINIGLKDGVMAALVTVGGCDE